MKIELNGKTAVIIGGSGGLGEAMAHTLSSAGAKIARLGELRRAGTLVPDGFVVTTTAPSAVGTCTTGPSVFASCSSVIGASVAPKSTVFLVNCAMPPPLPIDW